MAVSSPNVGTKRYSPDIATEYQAVVGAVQEKQKLNLEAEAERSKDLSTLAGSVENANELYKLAEKYQQAKLKNTPQAVDDLAELDKAFAEAGGDISIKLKETARIIKQVPSKAP